jgi:hypothetical protein
MAVTTGYNVTIKELTGGTCSCSAGVLTITGATCTSLPYMDTYTYDESINMIETTSFNDVLAQVVDGFPQFTVSISGGLDLTDARQLAFANNAACSTNRKPRVWRIGDGGKTHTFRGRVTGHSRGGSVGGKSTFSGTIQLTHLPKTC